MLFVTNMNDQPLNNIKNIGKIAKISSCTLLRLQHVPFSFRASLPNISQSFQQINTFLHNHYSYGVLVGTGAGLSFPPTVYIVTSYFVRLRGLANGICISGSALGSIILPPVLRWLLETYGYR